MGEKPPALAWVLLGIISLIWGSSFILIKKGLLYFDPEQVASLRIFSAAIFLTIPAIFTLKRVKKKHIGSLISIGFSGSLIPAFLFAFAQTKIDSSSAGVLNALTPLWVIIIGSVIFTQRVKWMTLVGLAIGFGGTMLLVISGVGSAGFNLYGLLVVGATVCYGFNLNLIKYKLPDLDAITITSASLVIVGPIAIFYLFGATDFVRVIKMEPPFLWALGAVVLLGVMGTAIALTLFNKLVHITSPVFASSVTYLIPIVAILWGVLDGETITIFQYMGMCLILIGVFVSNKSKSSKVIQAES